MAEDSSEEKKATIVDVTAEASKEVEDESKIVNTANDYKKYWENINEDERKMSNDTPNFHIYISYEKSEVYPTELEYDEEGNVIKPYAKKKTKKENSEEGSEKEGESEGEGK